MSNLDKINTILSEATDSQLLKVLDFIMFLMLKGDNSLVQDIESASLSSTDFWNNDDDEVWDHV